MATIKEVMKYALELDTKDFSKGLDKAEKDAKGTFDDIEDSAENTGGKFKGLGGKMGTALVSGFAAIGVGALLMKGINQAMDARVGVKRLQGQFAFTAEEAGRYGDLAGDLYKDGWGAGVEEVQQVVGLAAKKLGTTTTDELENISASVLAVSQTWGQDFDAVIRSTDQLIQNDLAPNAEAALDLIVAAFQGGGDEAGDLLDTIDEYSQHWADMGLDGEEALNQIIAGLQGGQRDADKLADAVKEMRIRVVDDSVSTAEAYDALGLNADDLRAKFLAGGDDAKEAFLTVIGALRSVEDPYEQNRHAVSLIGTQFEDLGTGALDALATIDGALDVTTGKAAELTETVEATDWEVFKRNAERGAGDAVEAMAGVLNSGMRRLAIDAAENAGNMDLAEWLSGGEQAWNDAEAFIKDFDLTLLDNVETFEEAREAALAYADDGLGETNEAMHAANAIALEWNDATEESEKATDDARRAAAKLRGEEENLRRTTEHLGDAVDDTTGDLEDVEDQLDDTVTAADNLKNAFKAMSDQISKDTAFIDVENQFADLEQSAKDLAEANETGGEVAEQALRDHKLELANMKQAVIDYAIEVGNIPPSKVTEINAMIDAEDFAAAEAALAFLERARVVNIRVQAAGGVFTPDIANAPITPGVQYYGAAGGIVNRPTSGITLGESGPEAVIPLDRSPGNSPLGNLGGGPSIVINVNAGLGTNGPQVGRQIASELEKFYRSGGRPPRSY